MSKSVVSIAVCENYDEDNVYRAVCACVDALGGIEKYVKKEEKILVKPNFLSPADVEKAITTHPSVIRSFCRLLSENGYGKVMVGDSPGSGSCKSAAAKIHISDEDLFGAKICDMSEEKEVHFEAGRVCKTFHFAREVTEADAIIGLSKMKTHMLVRVTGAVKNMYGLICGKRKAMGHVSFPTAVKFSKLMTDIHRATPQRLHIMDAVTAMEGNGPASGNPVNMGLILASADPVALDTVFCRLINLSPQLVPTIVQGEFAGIGTFKKENIELKLIPAGGRAAEEITGEELVRRYGKPDFDVSREGERLNSLSLLSRIAGGHRRPVINPEKCVSCGVCVRHCPVDGGAVTFKNGQDNPPVYDYKKCIRCYCCQELCPQKAISVKR